MNVSLYQAASALNAMDRWQETIAENLAASAVPGFKKQEFSFTGVLSGTLGLPPGLPPGASDVVMPRGTARTNFEQGALRPTGGKTDLALEGPAFFEVQLANGNTAFTRDGEFHVSPDGQLVNKQGYAVLGDGGPITIDRGNAAPIAISSNGDVSQGAEIKGRLKLTEFNDRALLTPIGSGLFDGQRPGLEANDATRSGVRQGFLEAANTSTAVEMAQMITAMRTFEANQRMIQLHDERVGQTINQLTPPA